MRKLSLPGGWGRESGRTVAFEDDRELVRLGGASEADASGAAGEWEESPESGDAGIGEEALSAIGVVVDGEEVVGAGDKLSGV